MVSSVAIRESLRKARILELDSQFSRLSKGFDVTSASVNPVVNNVSELDGVSSDAENNLIWVIQYSGAIR